MIGGIIGDLAASTYLRDPQVFYKQLFDEKATLSEYGLSIIAVASSLMESSEGNADFLREKTIELFKTADYRFTKLSDSAGAWSESLTMLNSSVAQGMLLNRLATNALISDNPERTDIACFFGGWLEKEEGYARMFINKMIRLLHSGFTKEQVYDQLGEVFKGIRHDWDWKEENTTLCLLMRAWDCFYNSFDFGSAIHNAVRYPNTNTRLLASLTGLIAEAMYGCRSYFVKKKFNPSGGNEFIELPKVFQKEYSPQLEYAKRQRSWNNIFWPKNDSRTNVDWHSYHPIKSRYEGLNVSTEIHRRILRSFEPGWESRYSFYLDNGWIYVCRSFCIIGRFRLVPHGDGHIISNVQQSDQNHDFDEAFNCAYDVVANHWATLGQLRFKYLRNYWFSIEDDKCPAEYRGTIKEKFWHGEKMFYETQMDNLGKWIEEGRQSLQTFNNPRATEIAKRLGQESFGVAYYINTLFAKWFPMDNLDWIFKY